MYRSYGGAPRCRLLLPRANNVRASLFRLTTPYSFVKQHAACMMREHFIAIFARLGAEQFSPFAPGLPWKRCSGPRKLIRHAWTHPISAGDRSNLEHRIRQVSVFVSLVLCALGDECDGVRRRCMLHYAPVTSQPNQARVSGAEKELQPDSRG